MLLFSSSASLTKDGSQSFAAERVAEPSSREADRESELAQIFTTVSGIFSEGPFASTVLAD